MEEFGKITSDTSSLCKKWEILLQQREIIEKQKQELHQLNGIIKAKDKIIQEQKSNIACIQIDSEKQFQQFKALDKKQKLNAFNKNNQLPALSVPEQLPHETVQHPIETLKVNHSNITVCGPLFGRPIIINLHPDVFSSVFNGSKKIENRSQAFPLTELKMSIVTLLRCITTDTNYSQSIVGVALLRKVTQTEAKAIDAQNTLTQYPFQNKGKNKQVKHWYEFQSVLKLQQPVFCDFFQSNFIYGDTPKRVPTLKNVITLVERFHFTHSMFNAFKKIKLITNN